jgi:hypothetical protein
MKKIKKIYDVCLINQNEIAMNYYEEGLFSTTNYYGFFDIEKDKKIQAFSYKYYFIFPSILCLINKELFLFANGSSFYPIHLKNHKKKVNIIVNTTLIILVAFKQFLV